MLAPATRAAAPALPPRAWPGARHPPGLLAVLLIVLLTLAVPVLPALPFLPVPAHAVAPAGPSTAPRDGYQWPTGARAQVVQGFDPPALRWGAGHRGVDLAASAGSPVLAAAAGTVAFAGVVAGRPVVSVDHADGLRTTYEPVEPCVQAGQVVAGGEELGSLLPGHRPGGPDVLHWGARRGRDLYVDPLRLLEPAVIRLKPL